MIEEHVLYRNETLQSIRQRHSIRQFTEQTIGEEDLLTILNAANHAPSAHNQQSWRFTVITGSKKQELVDLVSERSSGFPKPNSTLLRMAARSISSAPIVIAVMNTGELIGRVDTLYENEREKARDFFRIMEIQSSAAAVENMLIAATSIGLASVWLGILILIQQDVLAFLNNPNGEFMAVVPVGYAERPSSGPKKRTLDDVVRYS